MNMDIVVLEEVFLYAEGSSVASHVAEGRQGALPHYVTQGPRDDQLLAAFHLGRLDKDDVGPALAQNESRGNADCVVLLDDFEPVPSRTQIALHRLGRDRHRLRPGPSLNEFPGDLPAHCCDLPLETPDTRLPRVFPDDSREGLLREDRRAVPQSLVAHLLRYKEP